MVPHPQVKRNGGRLSGGRQLRRAPPRAAKGRPAAPATTPRQIMNPDGNRRVTRSNSARLNLFSSERDDEGDVDPEENEDFELGRKEIAPGVAPARGHHRLKKRPRSSQVSQRDAFGSKRPRRSAPTRNYYESESDDEEHYENSDDYEEEQKRQGEQSVGDYQVPATLTRVTRSSFHGLKRTTRQSGAYLSPVTDEETRLRSKDSSISAQKACRWDTSISSSSNAASTTSSPRSKRLRAATKSITGLNPAAEHATYDRPVLPWVTLPYLIMVEVFVYASAPLDDRGLVRWLLAASTTCRAWAEPALTALYRCPPLLTISMAHNLADVLARLPSETMFNYRQKVESLRIDVGTQLVLTHKGRHLDIETLVGNLPRLVSLDFFHQKDQPPYRELDERLRWSYPRDLFDLLAAAQPAEPSSASSPWSQAQGDHADRKSPTRLRHWSWNARMMGSDVTFPLIKSIHTSASFSTLRKLKFINHQRPSVKAKDADDPDVIAADKTQAEQIAGVLDVLPSLTHLVLESCSAANELLLPLLPKTLQHLELINCWDITADGFSDYLISHGQQLRHLTLNHNQSLSLAFLPVLGLYCPKLESLRMNFRYYNHHMFYRDSNPIYEDLLLPDQIPAWPRSIQVVELEPLRKWTSEAAEMFFQSLIDSAPEMPALRRLNIKALLDVPWRQRSAIREKWQARLKKCFLRKREEPHPWRSISDVAAHGQRDHGHGEPDDSNPLTDSSRASSVTRDLRKRMDRGRISYREPDTDSDEDTNDSEEKQDADSGDDVSEEVMKGDSTGFVHGLCDIVDLRFDNQKPTELEFRMDDFLDSDHDTMSDGDWDGDREVDDDNYAW